MTNTKIAEVEVKPLPSPEDFCLAVPLYASYSYEDGKNNAFFSIEHFKGTLDMFCPECGTHSVFRLTREAHYQDNSHARNYTFLLPFACSRNASHKADFIFRAHNGVIQKIGQLPSLADISTPDLKRYRQILGPERFRELTRGVGLATHGVGVGAFVYLRRVFEWLIEEAHVAAAAKSGWSEEAFKGTRMEDKITLLAEQLPEFLVMNRGLYGILSVGVHTLSEKECLDAFPAVKLAIELTLDDAKEKHEKNLKVTAAAKSLEALRGTMRKSAL